MIYSRILGTGSYVPDRVITNADLERLVDTTDEWIMQRVGVKERHVVGNSLDNTTTMAVEAAKKAIEAADIDPQSIQMIVVGTVTPEHFFPSTACAIQRHLNIQADIPAFDLNAACAGFIYALSIVDQYIRAGVIKTALVVGVEALTKLVDWKDRSTCILFGDGAGACLLQASQEPGILKTLLHANGRYGDLITCKNPLWYPQTPLHLKMFGNEVFKCAVTKLGEIVDETLAESGIEKRELDWLIPHQANMRIIQATAKRLNLPLERVILTIEHQGNTSSASIPLAFDYALRQGKIKRGETVLLEAFGAGLAWGSALLRY